MARFSRFILLRMFAFTLLQAVPLCSSTVLISVQSKAPGDEALRARLLDEATKPRNRSAALQLFVTSSQFDDDANSSESGTRGSHGRTVYTASAQLRMAMRATVLREKYLDRLVDGNRFGASKSVSSSGGQTHILPDSHVGQYTVQIGVGSPPQQLNLAIDTASRWVWVYEGYEGCYDSKASSTYADVACWEQGCQTVAGTCRSQDGNCGYDHQQSDGSGSSGRVGSDAATVKGDEEDLAVRGLLFGISDASYGFDKVAGVLGLGRSASSFASQLEAGSDISGSFAQCLDAWDASSSERGTMYFGSWDGGDDQDGFVYTPMLSSAQNPDFYYVELDCIQVAGSILDVPEGTFDIDPNSGYNGFFIDSGVAFTQLVPDAYNALLDEMKKGVIYPGVPVDGLELCYDTSSADGEPWFPSLTFVFGGGAQMDFPTENVFIKAVSGNDDIRCLGIQKMDKFNILGSVQQQNFLIQFDNANHQVGWKGPVQCSTDDY